MEQNDCHCKSNGVRTLSKWYACYVVHDTNLSYLWPYLLIHRTAVFLVIQQLIFQSVVTKKVLRWKISLLSGCRASKVILVSVLRLHLLIVGVMLNWGGCITCVNVVMGGGKWNGSQWRWKKMWCFLCIILLWISYKGKCGNYWHTPWG